MGININDVFPSKYLKAADLNGAPVNMRISDVQMATVGDDEKLVIYFHGKDKGVVLNKTNANNIAMVLGPDTDGWLDQSVQLYPTMVDFQGRSIESIRIKAMPRASGKRQGTPGATPSKPRKTADDPRTQVVEDYGDGEDPNDPLPSY